MRLFRSLLFQVVLWAIVPLLAITAVSVISIYGHQQAERDLVADRVARLAHVTSGSLGNELEDQARLLEAFGQSALAPGGASQSAKGDGDVPALRSAFDRGILWLSPGGETVTAAGDAMSWAGQPAVEELDARVRADRGPAVIGLPSGNPAGAVTLLAVPAAGGGILAGAFSSSNLAIDHVLDDLQLGARGSGFVVDASGAILYARDPRSATASQAEGQAGVPGFARALAGGSGALFAQSGGEQWAVSVADDGRGFDAPRSPGELAASGHFGLAGIRERVLLVGGQLAIDSAPGPRDADRCHGAGA